MPPYDKGSAIATLTAVMTEPLEEPRNAGPLKDVIHGLLTKDPAERLDDTGARAMLRTVIDAPGPKDAEPEPPEDATKVIPLPTQPGGGKGAGGPAGSGSASPSGSGGGRGEEAGDRLRGALRSVRKAGAATSTAAARTKSTADGTGSGPGSGAAAVASAEPRAQSASASGPAGGAQAGQPGSGWPVMTPPDLDLPPRPAPPRASLTDVVPRRTLVIVAVVVVLAVIGAVLALTLDGDDKDSGGAGNGADRTAATAGTSAGASAKEDASSGTGTDGDGADSATGAGGSGGKPATKADTETSDDDSGSGSGSGEDGSGEDGDDGAAVASTYRSAQGFSIGLPEGWKYATTGSAGVRFTGPDGQRLLVAWTSTPKGDPVADWTNQEKGMVRPQYKRVRIEKVEYRGWNTADWEFTYVDAGTKYRVIDRGFVVNDRLGHALMYTAKAANWDSDLRENTWETLTETFRPKKS